jgi:dihydrodipicolinate synthase/N-acetylneuraminate lyase
MTTKTVIPIPPSYYEDESINVDDTLKYLNFLYSKGIQTVMTTAGTSQFNLLTVDEIHLLNRTICNGYGQNKIIGVPPLSLRETKKFIKVANDYIDSKTKYLIMYPERHYDNNTIKEFFFQLKQNTDADFYIHTMGLRSGTGGYWEYESGLIKDLFEGGLIVGIKEEYSNIQQAFGFVNELPEEMDIIVAGGSMRRHNFLKIAGANSFLGGVGNLFPEIELDYCNNGKEYSLVLEKKLFDIFMKFGWHRALRIGISYLGLGCDYDRMPWPMRDDECTQAIVNCIEDIKNEK